MLFILLYSAGDVVRGSKRGTVCSFSANDAGLRMLIIRNNSTFTCCSWVNRKWQELNIDFEISITFLILALFHCLQECFLKSSTESYDMHLFILNSYFN